ncbi:DUF3868 domain-containing protein [Parabacteroides sp. PF5-9]|uniref:DUF3868 domain-containing protein n=1 Tax=Parabacteroides sp. PF5-9 TaxID=1742404 RepID=UPI002475C256|nr:DUF3868 domain-containing protein [Parabacteroides sp. PF5-9]MDH6357195.1 outer membrane protein OmpA-like peptidoglycan-associated protein [Parabacteroides sp. PF5-9]
MKKIYLILISLIALLPVAAGNIVYPENVKYAFRAEKEGNTLHLNLDIVLDEMHLPTQGMVVFTPVIIAQDQKIYHLAPAVVTGSNRYKVLQRLLAYDNPVFEQSPQVLVKRKNSSSQTISLSYIIPNEEWMQGADLYVYGEASGCVNCGNVQDQQLVKNDIVPLQPVYVPVYTVSYIVPEVEVKERSETFVARINYEVGRYELLPNYKNNAAVLADVDALVKSLQNDRDLTITHRTVTGYASPDGNFDSNLLLSQNRAKSFMDYLQQKYRWDANITYEGRGEDWVGLREAVENASNLSQKHAIIAAIDNRSDIARRKQSLKALEKGSVYKTLLNEYFPSLRRNEFKVSYIARAFNVEEAREVIRTRPQLLSLNEMFLVANSYPKESKEFKEVFDIAVRMFPDSQISKINAAAMEIETGSAERAIERLIGVETPEAWNNLGVAYAQCQEVDLARQYFQRAIQAGNTQALHNLEQLNKK